jgi:hypothetical protein
MMRARYLVIPLVLVVSLAMRASGSALADGEHSLHMFVAAAAACFAAFLVGSYAARRSGESKDSQ